MEDTDKKRVRFADLLILHINTLIKQKYLYEQMTPTVMRAIRETIREKINMIFNASKYHITPHARCWLSDQLFKSIKFNDDQNMNEQVIIHEYSLSEMPYSDVQMLRNLFNETSLAEVLEEEYTRRSAS